MDEKEFDGILLEIYEKLKKSEKKLEQISDENDKFLKKVTENVNFIIDNERYLTNMINILYEYLFKRHEDGDEIASAIIKKYGLILNERKNENNKSKDS